MRNVKPTIASAAAVLAFAVLPAQAQIPGFLGQISTGPNNDITDVPGLLVGHYEQIGDGFLTGTTVVYAPDGAVGGVDVEGGGPGTRETDLLDPGNLVNRVNAIVLSGGSAYGLDAAMGTMLWLEEQQKGYTVGVTPDQVVPIVPSAILFDLNRGGEFKARPTQEFGYNAIENAGPGPIAQGTVGAGTGASAGGVKGGIGSASADLGNGIYVAAIVGLNPAGRPFRSDTCEINAAYLEIDDEFGPLTAPTPADCEDSGFGQTNTNISFGDVQPMNTTIGIVATNFPLDKAQAKKMASVAHDGMARAIRPVHSQFDGDTIFAMGTGLVEQTNECGTPTEGFISTDTGCVLLQNTIYQAGADAFSRAIVHALLNAESAGGMTSYCDEFPTACNGTGGTGGGGTAPQPAPDPEPAPEGDGSNLPATGGGLALAATVAIAAGTRLRRLRRSGVPTDGTGA